MSDIAIQAEHLSKSYQIGVLQHRHHTLRDQIAHGFGELFRRNRQKRLADSTIWALRDVSFEVQRGEILGVIGRNGAGKSTLLKILSRITEPTSGKARIFGRVGSLLEIGSGFHPELTGRENIYLSSSLLGMTKRETDHKFDEIVSFAEIEQFLDTPVKRYSSGMYMRLAFAVAAHLETEILLVDEVLAVGDAAFQKKCLGKMGEVAHGGRTVLFVSHNMPMIAHLCQRGILLRRGAVVADGETNDVIGGYLAELASLRGLQLAERTDRSGTGEVIATKIELLDGDEKGIEHVATGQPLVVRIHYRCRSQQPVRNCRATLAVTYNEQIFLVLSTWMVDTEPLHLAGEGHLDLIVPELPLAAGTYHLDCILESNETHDLVEYATEISVVDGDFFGTGKIRPSPYWQNVGVLVRHSYRRGTTQAQGQARVAR